MSDKIWGDYDQAALDVAYNARQSVPDFDACIKGYVDESRRVRAALPGPRGVSYGPHRDQILDIFPAGTENAPVHLFLHGGYWRALTKDEHSFTAGALAPAGACVMVNTYSLCPDVHLDVIVRQCRDAVSWIYNNAGNHGGDPERIFISGHSAGGQLVGMMLATDWQAEYGLPADVIKGASAISGNFAMRPMRLTFTQEWLDLSQPAAARNAPLFNLPSHPCPVIIAWGGDDPAGFHEQGRAYIEALEGRGVPVDHIALPGCHHFDACRELMDPASPLTRAVLAQMGL